MNLTRVAIAAVVTWIVYLGVSFVVHTMILADIYTAHRAVMRPEDQANAILPVGFVFALVGFFAFAYAYAKGYEGGSGLQEGLRFGVIVGIFLCCFGKIWEVHGVARLGNAAHLLDAGADRGIRALRQHRGPAVQAIDDASEACVTRLI